MAERSLPEVLTNELMPLIERWTKDAYERGYRDGVTAASRGVEDRLRRLAAALGVQEGDTDG